MMLGSRQQNMFGQSAAPAHVAVRPGLLQPKSPTHWSVPPWRHVFIIAPQPIPSDPS
jgi:hypothetical protein